MPTQASFMFDEDRYWSLAYQKGFAFDFDNPIEIPYKNQWGGFFYITILGVEGSKAAFQISLDGSSFLQAEVSSGAPLRIPLKAGCNILLKQRDQTPVLLGFAPV